jgi:hypothetical protein
MVRTSVEVDVAAVPTMISCGMTYKQIANRLNVSEYILKQNIIRKLSGFRAHSSISDLDLLQEIASFKAQHPKSGEKYVNGHLLSMGVRVPRRRVRWAIQQIDTPRERESRKLQSLLFRRKYSVPGPNFVWHCDSYHKLTVQWKFPIWGAVDGYSRKIMFLEVGNNYKAETVFESFIEACVKFNEPSKICIDKGTENFAMRRYLGEERAVVVKSVHNSRVERIWRELWTMVIVNYYNIFTELTGPMPSPLLDNAKFIFLLHYFFMDSLKKDLHSFQRSFNFKKIRTAGERSPNQMYLDSTVNLENVHYILSEEVAQLEENQDLESISSPTSLVRNPFSPEELAGLPAVPHSESLNGLKNLFLQVFNNV